MSEKGVNELIKSIEDAQKIGPDTRTMPEGETWWRRVPLVANLLRFTNFAFKPIDKLIDFAKGIQLPPTVGVISPYIALAIGIFDFLYIPFLAIGGYMADPEAETGIRGFYRWLKSGRCPLNYTHIGRMAMSALSIAAVSVIIATGGALAPIMLTVIASAIFVVAVSTLVKTIIWNREYTAELKDNQNKQTTIIDEMNALKSALENSNTVAINAHIDSKLKYFRDLKNKSDEDVKTELTLRALKQQFLARQQQFNQTPVNANPDVLLNSLLQPLGAYVQNQQDRLQALRARKVYLQKEIDRTGMFAVGYKAGMATIAAATVAGFALCLVPGLNIIGIPLIAAAAAISGAVVIGRAIHLFCTKPEARKDKPLLGVAVAALAGIVLCAIPGINVLFASASIILGGSLILGALIAGAARIIYKNHKEKEAAKNNSQSELGNMPPKPGTEAVNSSSYDKILGHLNSIEPIDHKVMHSVIKSTAALLKHNPTRHMELYDYLNQNQQIKDKFKEFKAVHEQRTAASDNEPLLPNEDVDLVFSAAKL